ncbi:MAG: hypothetical protein ACRYGM_06480, partial [Janthinobacterium lividum]
MRTRRTHARLMAFTALTLLGGMLDAQPVRAWGHAGHVGISQLAIQQLPAELPAFVRSAQAAQSIGELGAEADESKTTGVVTSASGRITTAPTVHDAERDPGHYIDFDDNGLVLGGVVALNAMPATREAFDTAQRTATAPGGQTQYSAGYLHYNMIDGFQQVRKDFGMWRALQAGLGSATSPADRAYFQYQLQLRQQLTLRDIGYWSHFVADGSQPMHVSVHFNGWGNYPNPRGYTTSGIHSPFEGSFVRNFIDFSKVAAAVPPPRDCGCTIEQRVPQYLGQSLQKVVPVYEAAGFGGSADLYRSAVPAELAIVTERLAAGAAELRDQITDAWRQSADISVGFPLVRVRDAEAGTVRITPAT